MSAPKCLFFFQDFEDLTEVLAAGCAETLCQHLEDIEKSQITSQLLISGVIFLRLGGPFVGRIFSSSPPYLKRSKKKGLIGLSSVATFPVISVHVFLWTLPSDHLTADKVGQRDRKIYIYI